MRSLDPVDSDSVGQSSAPTDMNTFFESQDASESYGKSEFKHKNLKAVHYNTAQNFFQDQELIHQQLPRLQPTTRTFKKRKFRKPKSVRRKLKYNYNNLAFDDGLDTFRVHAGNLYHGLPSFLQPLQEGQVQSGSFKVPRLSMPATKVKTQQNFFNSNTIKADSAYHRSSVESSRPESEQPTLPATRQTLDSHKRATSFGGSSGVRRPNPKQR